MLGPEPAFETKHFFFFQADVLEVWVVRFVTTIVFFETHIITYIKPPSNL